MNQQATTSYRGDNFTAQLNVQAYELASVAVITPYNRLPQITFNGSLPYHPADLNFTYETEAVRFERSLETGTFSDKDGNVSPRLDTNVTGLSRANGDRLNLKPGVNLPLNWTYGFVTPSLKYQYTQYDLDLGSQGKADIVNAQFAAAQAGTTYVGGTYNSSESRGVPIASIDSGLYFDRNTDLFGTNYRQTLEPRLFYLYVPERNQQDIPVFDTGETSFNYASLFRDNRFSGNDRVGDENKLSLGVTSRWIEDNGFERQRVSIGQALYFKDRTVQLPGVDFNTRPDAKTNVSPYALEYAYNFNRDWRATADYNWDPVSHSPRSGSAMFHYQPEDNPNKVINAGYRYRNDQVIYNQNTGQWQFGGDYGVPGQPGYVKDYYKIEQHDFSVIWPVAPQWNVISRWQYDYNRNRTLEAFGGFEYDNCCWKLRLISRYWVQNDEYSQLAPQNEQGDHGIFLQFVLKGLGGVMGNKVESFLDKGIQGYREREDQAF